MKTKITKRTVDSTAPGTRDAFIWDTETRGFGLKVTPKGRKIYVLQARLKGRVRRFTIGEHGAPWTAEAARVEARRLHGFIAAGQDPAEEKRRIEADRMTVAELCDLYLAEGCTTKKPGTLEGDRTRIARHIKPLLGKIRLADLRRADIERAMADIAAGKTARDERTGPRGRSIIRGGKGAASRVVGLLGAILEFGMQRDLRADNPARGVKRYQDTKRERYLSAEELARLGNAIRAAKITGENPFAIAAIRLLALTGCRKNEILSLHWKHVDLERGLLLLPDSKTGQKTAHLNAPAIQLLSELPHLDDNPHVICGAAPGGCLVNLQKCWNRIREAAGLQDVRIHDLRHSFASVAAAGGYSLPVIGALLGHSQATTTARYTHLANDPVRQASEATAANIAAAMQNESSAEVLSIRTRKG